MKKFLHAVFFVAIAIAFTSCGKEDTANGIDIEKTFSSRATIEGYAYVNVNNGTTLQQYAPEGTVLTFRAESESYIQGMIVMVKDFIYDVYGNPVIDPSTGNFLTITYPEEIDATGYYVTNTTVDADGHYSISFPTFVNGDDILVEVSGAQFHMPIQKGSVTEDMSFKLSLDTVFAISGYTHQKNLEYESAETLNTSDNTWKKGTCTFTFNYNNDLTDPTSTAFIPAGTKVMVTVKGDQYIPERINDVVYETTVGADGVLTIELDAPLISYAPHQLNFTIESSVILPIKTGVDGNGADIMKRYIFTMGTDPNSLVGGFVIGNENVKLGEMSYTQGSPIE